jgi:aminotransferase
MADFSGLSSLDDVKFVHRMIETVGVAAVPGSSFHNPKERGRKLVRFMFAKTEETLNRAGEKLQELRGKLTE